MKKILLTAHLFLTSLCFADGIKSIHLEQPVPILTIKAQVEVGLVVRKVSYKDGAHWQHEDACVTEESAQTEYESLVRNELPDAKILSYGKPIIVYRDQFPIEKCPGSIVLERVIEYTK